MVLLLVLGAPGAQRRPRGVADLLPFLDLVGLPEPVPGGDRVVAEDLLVEDRGRDEHPPLQLDIRVAGHQGLPEQAVRAVQDLVELVLGEPARLLGLVALGHVDHDPGQVPLARAGRADDDLLAEPVDPLDPNDPKLLLVPAGPFGEGLHGGGIHALVVGRLFFLPEIALLDQRGELVDGVLL